MQKKSIAGSLLCRREFGRGVTVLLALFMLLFTACQDDSEENIGSTQLVNVGDEAPAFTLSGPDGEKVTPSLLNGRPYLLSFFDTSCPDCQKELQVLQRIYDKYKDEMPIFNVPRSQTIEEAQAYWDKAGLNMPIYTPNDKNLYYKFANSIIPRTYVIDSNGKVHAAFDDSPVADYDTLDAIIQQLQKDANTVNMSFKIKLAPRSLEDEKYYFHNEYVITKLDVYFFDATTKKLFSRAEARNLTEEGILPNYKYDITYIFDDVRVHAGIYDIFIIANYENAPTELEDEDELLNMIDSVTYYTGVLSNIPEEGAIMTNRATSDLAVDLTQWANKRYVQEVELERVMAKLQIGVKKDVYTLYHNGEKYADINITNYKLVNMNRQYYLFQHKDSLTELGEQPVFTLPDNFSDYVDEGEQYIVDPYFYKKKPTYEDAVAFDNYYFSWFGNFTTDNFASMPAAGSFGYAYILENTSFKTSQKNGYSPGIIFKAAVSPKNVYLYDQSRQSLEAEERPEYWPSTIYLYDYNFYESIQAINIVSGLGLDELASYTDTELADYNIKQCKFNMGAYETYYTYWIQHRSPEAENMEAMKFGIVRNNFYKIHVDAISDLGTSTVTPVIMRNNFPNTVKRFSKKGIKIN